MAFQMIIHFIIAFLWMFLNNAWTLQTFVSGFLIGLAILYLIRGFFPQRLYVYFVIAVLKLLLIFLRELFLSTVSVVSQIIRPKLQIQPGIFAMDVDLEKDWQITLLSSLITLTPGTVVVDISEDNKTLYVHAIHLPDIEKAKDDINNTFVKAIQEVTP